MIVLGVDSSLVSTGLALLDTDVPEWLTDRVRSAATETVRDQARRLRVIARRIVEWTATVDPPFATADLIVIEGPSFGSRNGAVLLGGLWWRVVDELCQAFPAAEVLVVPPNTRALYATGDGHAKKPAVLACVRAEYDTADVPNHDVADAVALAALGARVLGVPVDGDVSYRVKVAERLARREAKEK